MVTVKSWKEYEASARKDPKRFRYCIKFRASKQDLVVKATNDDICYKYKTQSASILNRFESLNKTLMYAMANAPIPQPVAQPATTTQQHTDTATTTASSKKKKNKKRK
ncbi:hypothetical protein E3P99_01826 [Wallemia hederae]|uniref:SRP9 domain-containing protein n=1 Tax=Wallemia hederae TaxID=1540922 RepID=A0A4V4LTE2_9BASI|nr:hypothetical protein E3P99_01826 [Wallemia hederae]